MLVLRVRCVDDGRELLVERHGADEHCVQVAELKKLILLQRKHLSRSGHATDLSDPSELEDCFVLLRGQILADPDVVDLNALRPSDFFVFAPDASQPAADPCSTGEMHESDVDSATLEVLRVQLVDMGFSTELAAQALQQTGNNLSDAVALLTEGKIQELVSTTGEEKETDLLTQHPSIAPLGSLVHDGHIRRLRELAAMDSFQALLLLKEHFSSEMLNQLNENPVATLRLLSLPPPTRTTSASVGKMQLASEEVIDGENREWDSSKAERVIDRLVAMGFARDLVQVMLESCAGDEQLTVNALLQTLES